MQEAAKQFRKTRTWHRVQAVILAKQGDTAPDIARARRRPVAAPVQTWVTAYNRGGLDAACRTARIPGRAPILPRARGGPIP